jgi:hypothetical protein
MSSASTNQKTLVAPVNLSLLRFTQDIKAQVNTFNLKYVNVTIMWCLKLPMALKWLIG